MRRLLAVLGGDVSGSLSPRLHAAAAAALGRDLAYVPVSCADAPHFRRAVEALATLGALGANVTMPFKADALALAGEQAPAAVEIGAANTLSFRGGTVHADNTDGPALVQVLRGLPPGLLARVSILGAGGAARAAVWALARLGAAEPIISSRRGPRPLSPVAGASLVISALPGAAEVAGRALAEWIDLHAEPFVLDLAYGPAGAPSALVAAARARGLTAQDGLGLLVEQAALSHAAWTGGEVSLIREAMKAEAGRGL